MEAEKNTLLKSMIPKVDSVAKVNQNCKDLEYEMQTRTLNATQEQKMIREIQKLKASIPHVTRY